jgi:hypothetical protein
LVNSSECESCRQKRKDRQNKTYKNNKRERERIKNGLCSLCGEQPLVNARECETCRQSRRDRQKLEYENRKENDRLSHKIRAEQFIALGLCYRCGNPKADDKKRCDDCIKQSFQYHIKLKDEAYLQYGGYECNCCKETIKDFLTLDHIHNDGAKHRREISTSRYGKYHTSGGHGKSLYLWLKRNGYPNVVQVLCMNCNWGKRVNGICPHKQNTLDKA